MSRIAAFLMSILLGLGGCGDGSAPPPSDSDAFCARLVDLRYGRIDVDHENPNEFVGHVKSLEALIEVAPPEIRDDLRFVRDKLARARDAGGWSTLFDFAALQDPEIGNAEGRVTRFVARACGIQYGELDWEMEPPGKADPVCPAWPRFGSPLVRNRFPYVIATAAANYFSAQFWSVPFLPAPEGFLRVPRGGRVVFEGESPYARYFALHPNDFETENDPTLRDVDLDPDPGSANPWREPVEEGVGRHYTAQLVFTTPPRHPEPNTTYVGEAVKGDSIRLSSSSIGSMQRIRARFLPTAPVFRFRRSPSTMPRGKRFRISTLVIPIRRVASFQRRDPGCPGFPSPIIGRSFRQVA